MPYYRAIHLFFIHIPKTGGTSIESFLNKFCNQELFTVTPLHADKPQIRQSIISKSSVLPNEFKKISYQHQTYSTIYKHRLKFNIDFDGIKMLAVVRNPYHRALSDLFFFGLVDNKSSKNDVYEALQKFVHSEPSTYDNHNIPQYKFVCDEYDNIVPNITILKTENLTEQMKQIGFVYDEPILNKGGAKHNYDALLNIKSIRLINNIYKRDFAEFGYHTLQTNNNSRTMKIKT